MPRLYETDYNIGIPQDNINEVYIVIYGVYLFNMLFTKFLLTQILEILMVNKLV